jgi:hypothetical protein
VLTESDRANCAEKTADYLEIDIRVYAIKRDPDFTVVVDNIVKILGRGVSIAFIEVSHCDSYCQVGGTYRLDGVQGHIWASAYHVPRFRIEV